MRSKPVSGPADRCPACGQPNSCALAAEPVEASTAAPCWCVNENFPPELTSAWPADRCLCARCLAASKAARCVD